MRWSMKEFFKRVKANMIFGALMCLLLGIVLLVWPKETIDIFCKVLALGLVIMGVVDLASYFMNRTAQTFSGIVKGRQKGVKSTLVAFDYIKNLKFMLSALVINQGDEIGGKFIIHILIKPLFSNLIVFILPFCYREVNRI